MVTDPDARRRVAADDGSADLQRDLGNPDRQQVPEERGTVDASR